LRVETTANQAAGKAWKIVAGWVRETAANWPKL
jgi:hypothetical protein